MFFCKVAVSVSFLLIRHQVIAAQTENVTFIGDNLTTADYENETSTTEYPNSTAQNVSFIPEGYNRTLPPEDQQTVMYIYTTGIVKDRYFQSCNLTLFIDLEWKDDRLFEENRWWNITKTTEDKEVQIKDIWHPRSLLRFNEILDGEIVTRVDDLHPFNESARTNYLAKALYYRISHMKLKLGIEPNFQKFPADKHRFELQLWASDLQYYPKTYWVAVFSNLDKDLVFDVDVKAVNFNKTHFKHDRNDVTNNVAVYITFQRRIGNHIIQTYIPSGLFLILSWLSMFLPLDIATERVALCTATLLTLTTFTSTAKLPVPEVSYMTGLDLWIVVSTLFIFFILVENICVLRITAKKSGNVSRTRVMQGIVEATTKMNVVKMMKLEKEENMTSSTSNQNQDAIQEVGEARPSQVSKSEEWKALAGKLDNISAAVIAILWIIFNVTYWIGLFANDDLIPDNSTSLTVHKNNWKDF